MKGKIAYRFETPVHPGNILYVNLIANYSCVNDCSFCERPRDKDDFGEPNIYENKAETSLFLPESPSIEDIMESIDEEIKDDDQEVAIIGLGEPLIYLPKVLDVVRRVKEKYDVKTRVDTNGLVKCMYEKPTEQLEAAGLNEIRISLNAVTRDEYNKLCKPQLRNAFENLVEFVRECAGSSIDTYVSFVVGFSEDERPKEEMRDFAVSLGVKPDNVIFRDYIEPINGPK